jgi:hypothetical protein
VGEGEAAVEVSDREGECRAESMGGCGIKQVEPDQQHRLSTLIIRIRQIEEEKGRGRI